MYSPGSPASLPSTLRKALCAIVILAVPATQAGTMTVNNTDDSGPGSLRQAILDAAPGDEIRFDAALDGLPIVLTTGQLAIDKELTITGRGQDSTIVDGNGDYRPFFVSGPTVVISGMTIRNGYAASDCDFSHPDLSCGGGILVDHADLTLTDCTISGNSAGDGFELGGEGGGIFNRGGNLTLNSSIVSGNYAHEGRPTDPNVWEPDPGHGGGILSAGGALTLNHSTVSGNRADVGGGIINWANGTVTLNHSTVSGHNWGGGICHFSGSLVLAHSSISNNRSSHGGGILNWSDATLTDSTIRDNQAYRGGGIYNSGALILADSTVAGNATGCCSSQRSGGGIHNTVGGTAMLTTSTVSGNSASSGGGIYNRGALTLDSSTVSGNSARYSGGGISDRDGTVALNHVTVSGNSGDEVGGIYVYGTSLTLNNSIVGAQSGGGDCRTTAGIVSLGHNLDSDGTCNLTQPTDLPGTDPLLGPLDDNGGPTLTHALLEDSPAVDAGGDTCGPTDQRGVPRPLDGDGDGVPVCDIGAYEFPSTAMLVTQLADAVAALGLPHGIRNAMLAKLNAAMLLLTDVVAGNDRASANVLGAFVNQLEAQRGKKIPADAADALIEAAQEIISLLEK